MINLILDTNAWIYLANGFNPNTEKYEQNSHFQMLEWIETNLAAGKLSLFINEVIEIEWNRNKSFRLDQVKKLKTQIENIENGIKNKRKRPDFLHLLRLDKVKINELNILVSNNEEHIKKVDNVLSKSNNIPITKEQKIKVIDWAIHKTAPFHNKPNSVGDALIFLSIVDYFEYYPDLFVDDTIFVSNNTSDFSDGKNKARLHPELQELINRKPIVYETNLASVMSLGENIIKEYKEFMLAFNREYYICKLECRGYQHGMAEVDFYESINVRTHNDEDLFNPNQVRIQFGDESDLSEDEIKTLTDANYQTIRIGNCGWCNATHVLCHCGELNATYDDKLICDCGNELSTYL